jgi:hypothetical protein
MTAARVLSDSVAGDDLLLHIESWRWGRRRLGLLLFIKADAAWGRSRRLLRHADGQRGACARSSRRRRSRPGLDVARALQRTQGDSNRLTTGCQAPSEQALLCCGRLLPREWGDRKVGSDSKAHVTRVQSSEIEAKAKVVTGDLARAPEAFHKRPGFRRSTRVCAVASLRRTRVGRVGYVLSYGSENQP